MMIQGVADYEEGTTVSLPLNSLLFRLVFLEYQTANLK